jgi:hypothetical protein
MGSGHSDARSSSKRQLLKLEGAFDNTRKPLSDSKTRLLTGRLVRISFGLGPLRAPLSLLIPYGQREALLFLLLTC